MVLFLKANDALFLPNSFKALDVMLRASIGNLVPSLPFYWLFGWTCWLFGGVSWLFGLLSWLFGLI
jgi:hypothetical protein